MRATSKKVRETRAAYRVRTKRTMGKPSAQLARTRKPHKPRVTVVPWTERIAPTDEQLVEWDAWLSAHEAEFEDKYPGHYLAVWDKQIVAATTQRDQIYPLVHQARPEVIPLIAYIPRADEVYMIPSVFPAEWRKTDAE